MKEAIEYARQERMKAFQNPPAFFQRAEPNFLTKFSNLGIDNIWIELFDRKMFSEEFNIGENIIPICIINLGYKADDCPESKTHNIRKNLNVGKCPLFHMR